MGTMPCGGTRTVCHTSARRWLTRMSGRTLLLGLVLGLVSGLVPGLVPGLGGRSHAAGPESAGDPPELVVAPQDNLAELVARLPARGRLRLRAGIHQTNRPLRLERPGVTVVGDPGAVVRPTANFVGDALWIVAANDICLERLKLDGEFVATRGIRSQVGSSNLVIQDCEICRWGKHAVDLDGARQWVRDCHIHHCLQKTAGASSDAHGVVTLHAQGLRIERCRIGNCSGDSVQTDRGQWQDVEIIDCELFLEPLAADMGGFQRGDLVGENALDTKREAQLPEGRIVMNCCRMWGFEANVQEGNWAALNIKENVSVTVQGCQIRASRIGARLSGSRKGGHTRCLLRECQFEGCRVGCRFEDQTVPRRRDQIPFQVSQCQFRGCEQDLEYDRVKPAVGAVELPATIEVSGCEFASGLRLKLGTSHPLVVQEARRLLLEEGGNSEQTPGAAPMAPPSVRLAGGVTDRTASQTIDPDGQPICPANQAHRGRVYRQIRGQSHCKCATCGTLWTLPSAALAGTDQNVVAAPENKPENKAVTRPGNPGQQAAKPTRLAPTARR